MTIQLGVITVFACSQPLRRCIPLVLLNYKNHHTLKQTDVMTELVFKGYIDEVTSATSYYSDQSTAKVDCTGELNS